jgi:replicative DNA helicase
MILLSESGSPIDLITLGDELRKSADFERVGGATYISSLIDGVPRTDSVVPYARIVTEKSLRRKLILASNQIEALAMGEDEQVGSVIETAERLFCSIRERQPSEPRPLVNAEERHLVERAEPIIPGVVYRRKITSFGGAPGSAKTTRKDNIYRLTTAGRDVVRGFETNSEVLAEAGPNSDLYWPLCVPK